MQNECAKIQAKHVVIVVDNASTDESYSSLTHELPQAHVLRCFENQGFARGNNQGAEYAIAHFHPSHILFSNNDISFLDSDVVDVLIEMMKSHPEAGIMGPQVLGMDGKRQSPNPQKTFAQQYLLPTWGKFFYSSEKLREFRYMDYMAQAGEGECGWVSGSCFLVDAKVFEQSGGFDPATFLYGEEQILTARFAGIGKIVYFYPGVTVIHQHGAVTRKYFDERKIRKMVFRSHVYYYRHYAGTPLWQIALGYLTLWLNFLIGK